MASWKEVFHSKVLQKLYPAAPKSSEEPSPPRIVEALSKKICVKRRASQEGTGDAAKTPSAANPGRRMYTVLPPPADYKMDSEKFVTLPQLESINNAEDPAEERVHDSNDDPDQDKEGEEQQKRKRRRRKKKPALGQEIASELSTGQSEKPMDEGGERISRNKKRKLKKKRHKEKLLSMGLMPQAAALEFTYQKDGVEEEEEEDDDDDMKAAEVSGFLRTTMEIYMSDSSLQVDKLPLLSGTLDDLLSRLASSCKPTAVLKQLHSLKAFVQQKETGKLANALKELYNTSTMSAEETTAVVSLFQYWITDILPMQGEKTTGFSTVHP